MDGLKIQAFPFLGAKRGLYFRGQKSKFLPEFHTSAASCTVSKASKLRASDRIEMGVQMGAPYHTMGLVYLPTKLVDFYGKF